MTTTTHGLPYAEAKAVAAALLRRERHAPTQPTSLVHSAWLRLRASGEPPTDRAEFLALIATIMRRMLVDRARRRRVQEVDLDDRARQQADDDGRRVADERVEALEAAVVRLQQRDAELARLVELRWFLELDVTECASAMECSTATVKRRWRAARAWLARELEDRS